MLVKKDISGTTFTAMRQLTNVNGRLFFTATESRHGEELWTSDGTGIGNPSAGRHHSGGGQLPNPVGMTLASKTLFFSATNSTTNQGTELWALYLGGSSAAHGWRAYR